MNELLKVINEHKDKNNISICYKLYNFILDNDIKTDEELHKIENDRYQIADIKIRNEIKYNSYLSDLTHHEKIDANDRKKLVEYEKSYEKEKNDILKSKYIILIYELNNWDLVFPYIAYKLIEKDLLN